MRFLHAWYSTREERFPPPLPFVLSLFLLISALSPLMIMTKKTEAAAGEVVVVVVVAVVVAAAAF